MTAPDVWDAEEGRRRCTATANRTGQRCELRPIKGANVCRVHGGSAPQVKAAARLRLSELTEPAMAVLRDVMADRNATNADKLRAAAEVLDRGGYPRGATLDVSIDELAARIAEG